MSLSKFLVDIFSCFKLLWPSFLTKNSPEPDHPVDLPSSPIPFRLLELPSLAHDDIFSQMGIEGLYHLSKCSRRSRNAVKVFTRRQKSTRRTHFMMVASDSWYCVWVSYSSSWMSFFDEKSNERILVINGKDRWAETKEDIAYCMDVFTDRVGLLFLFDTTKVREVTEFLKTVTSSPFENVYYSDDTTMDDEIYRYALKEFKNAGELEITGDPSPKFRFNDMEPFTGEELAIHPADWLTVDHLIRCFVNVERVSLTINPEKSRITPASMRHFFNAWRNGSKIKLLNLKCNWTNVDLQFMFLNVPKTEVRRVEIDYENRVFRDGECFLIRQEESGVEAIAFLHHGTLKQTTDFRLLRDDEPI